MYRELALALQLFVAALIGVIFALWLVASAWAQGDSNATYWNDPRIRACCSVADAVYADDWRVLPDGSVLARVTGGGPRNHEWAPIGREYVVPAERVVDVPGNPTGRPLLFISPGTLGLFCFATGPMG
jgi:hypothetical protein